MYDENVTQSDIQAVQKLLCVVFAAGGAICSLYISLLSGLDNLSQDHAWLPWSILFLTPCLSAWACLMRIGGRPVVGFPFTLFHLLALGFAYQMTRPQYSVMSSIDRSTGNLIPVAQTYPAQTCNAIGVFVLVSTLVLSMCSRRPNSKRAQCPDLRKPMSPD